jgi:hypothetical protein
MKIHVLLFLIFVFLIQLGPLSKVSAQNSCDPAGNTEGTQGNGGMDPTGQGNPNDKSWSWPTVHAVDPNDIRGPKGVGNKRWMSSQDVFSFTIRYENDPKFANGPAQKVIINFPVDPKYDINSIRIGSFGFGKNIFEVPPNSPTYYNRLDVRDSLGVYVDVLAGINITNNEAIWVLQSIDPLTGLEPENALLGFLPVRDTSINRFNDTVQTAGEGFVTFTIKAKPGVVTGDTANAQASIIFDLNAPIVTNVEKHTLDAAPPVSTITGVQPVSSRNIQLTFSGSDDPGGVGIEKYDLYVKEDTLDYFSYAANLSGPTFRFTGKPGSTYKFFALATDSVGNREALKSSPDVTTRVVDSVSQNQPPLANAGPDQFITEAGQVVLNGSGSSDEDGDSLSYSWIAPAGIHLNDSTAVGPQFSVSSAQNGIYSIILRVSDSQASDTDTMRVQVQIEGSIPCGTPGNPLPPKPVISANGPLSFCQGGTVVLTTSAAGNHKWSTGETTASITVSIGSTITDTAYSGTCKSVSDPVVVTVNPNPTKPVISGGPLTFCQGGSVVLSTNATGSHKWSTGATTATISINASGSVRDTAILGTCKVVSDPVVVTVNPNPTKPVISGGPLTFCQGGSVVLSTSATGSHKWSTGATTPTISINTSGSIRDTAILGTCKVVSDPVVVTVNALPTVDAGLDIAVVQNSGNTTLTGIPSGGTWSGTGVSTGGVFSSSGSIGQYKLNYCVTNAQNCTKCDSLTANITNGIPVEVATPVISPGTGSYNSSQLVSISCSTPGAQIYYTTTGNTPVVGTTFTKLYSAPFQIISSTNVKAIGVLAGSSNSAVSSSFLTILNPGIVSAPVITPGTGTVSGPVSVSITCATPNADIYYTTSGNTPVVGTTFTKLYTGPFNIIETSTVKAMAVRSGLANSSVVVSNITMLESGIVKNPVISPGSGTFDGSVVVSISTSTPDAQIYYSTSGNTPVIGTGFTRLYTGPFTLNRTTTVRAMAMKTGLVNSGVTVANLVVNAPSVVAAPTFSPAPGTYPSRILVSISSATDGAQIYFTNNGITPSNTTLAARLYSTPINVGSSGPIKAIAYKAGLATSPVSVGSYVIGAARVSTESEGEEPFYYLQTEPDESQADTDVDVIPNPSNGRFRITTSQAMKDAHIHIYNMLGQLVSKSDAVHDQLSFDVDISQQPTGFYTVVLMDGNARKVIRVTKE